MQRTRNKERDSMKTLLTGDEAIARGAYQAGVKFASAYPGTPSTEILENMTRYGEVRSEWAPNEKVALEAAAGASIAGVRSLASMKHVGVNVAADPLFTIAYTGINAGLLLICADEPGQHSSQNEQDNRNYAVHAKIPMLEPSDSMECIDMVQSAYELSERFDSPVMLRVTTRVCHSKSIVETSERTDISAREYKKDVAKYVAVPALARGMRARLEDRIKALAEFSNATSLNRIENAEAGKTGVIASGMAYCYAREVFGDDVVYLKLGFTHPLPNQLLDAFYKLVDKVYVIEENDPYLENWIKSCGYKCHGKDLFPTYGEITPDVIRKAVFGSELPAIGDHSKSVLPRPPIMCAGCPHRGFFYELAKRKNTVIAGDIGCYTLGFSEPFNAMDFVICMGAAFTAGHGAQAAFDMNDSKKRVVAVMGDSTFFHTGVNGLMEILYNNTRTICVVLDNRITGMTGQQEHPGTGKNAKGEPALEISIEDVARALGAKNVTTVNPNDLKSVRSALDEAYAKDEPSVIITRWPCVLKRMDENERAEFARNAKSKGYAVTDACIGCKACLRCGCPAISFNVQDKHTKISDQCLGCGVCAQICPVKAIEEGGQC